MGLFTPRGSKKNKVAIEEGEKASLLGGYGARRVPLGLFASRGGYDVTRRRIPLGSIGR